MSFDCSSLCFENSFLAALIRFGLVKGDHCSLENAKESLIECFSATRPSDESIRDTIAALQQRSSEISLVARQLYSQGLEYEYGLQRNLLSSESCPNVSLR